MLCCRAVIETERLILRRWRESDKAAFAEMNSDPVVMEFFPAMLTAEQSDALAAHADAGFDTVGYGLFAVEVKGGLPFAGFVGLATLEGSDLPVPGDAEVGWRLCERAWGHGYATEAATASLRFGFETIGLGEIVSFTSTTNLRSQAVMRKIGMHRDAADDFEHPRVAEGDPLKHHVVYRLSASEWEQTASP